MVSATAGGEGKRPLYSKTELERASDGRGMWDVVLCHVVARNLPSAISDDLHSSAIVMAGAGNSLKRSSVDNPTNASGGQFG